MRRETKTLGTGNVVSEAAREFIEAFRELERVEITPEMVAAAREVFDTWMDETNYLEDGFPGDSSVDSAIFSMLAVTRSINPVSSKKATNLRDMSLRLLAAARSSSSV